MQAIVAHGGRWTQTASGVAGRANISFDLMDLNKLWTNKVKFTSFILKMMLVPLKLKFSRS